MWDVVPEVSVQVRVRPSGTGEVRIGDALMVVTDQRFVEGASDFGQLPERQRPPKALDPNPDRGKATQTRPEGLGRRPQDSGGLSGTLNIVCGDNLVLTKAENWQRRKPQLISSDGGGHV